MTIVAHFHPFVIGVDTHAQTHTLVVLAASGELAGQAQFPASPSGCAAQSSGPAGAPAATWPRYGPSKVSARMAPSCPPSPKHRDIGSSRRHKQTATAKASPTRSTPPGFAVRVTPRACGRPYVCSSPPAKT